MLAEHLHGMEHDHGTIERGASAIWRGCRVCGNAVKSEESAIVGEARSEVHLVRIAGMPIEDGVHIFEQARVDHVDLAAASLLGGSAEIANGAVEAPRLHLLLDCHCGESGGAA